MNPMNKALKVVFFGDSICYGQRVSTHLIWATRTCQDMHDAAGERSLTVVNASVNGDTTRLALERMPKDLQRELPDLVYIQFGLNDCNFWQSDAGHPRVSLKAYESNLEEMVVRARLSGARFVILATNHLTQPGGPCELKISAQAPVSYRENIMAYNNAVRRVARAMNCDLIDIEKAWLEGPEVAGDAKDHLDPDGLHLSRVGHDLYYRTAGKKSLEAFRALL